MSKIVIIRLAGQIHRNKDIADTFTLLKLLKKHTATLVEDSPSLQGMLKKIAPYTTYGIADDATVKLFGDSKIIHLHPPRGGYERKGTKKPFTVGGAWGDRKELINILIQKMIVNGTQEKKEK